MITLKTLPQATAQEVFDQVATHLLTQNKQSIANGGCAYRGEDGLKCAAGCLIGDDEYYFDMENNNWASLIVPEQHRELISELQDIHDTDHPNAWQGRLKSVAYEYNLEFNHDK